MSEGIVEVLQKLGDSPEEEEIINDIGGKFDKLGFDTKINVVNALKEYINNVRKGSIHFDLQEEYLQMNARRESIMKSMQHMAEDTPLYVKIALVLCIIGGSLSLPIFKILNIKSPYLMSAWRFSTAAILFAPLAYYECIKHKEGTNKLFSTKNILMVILGQVFNSLYTFCQVMAMQYTYTSHVMLFSGMLSIVIIFWKFMKRLPITSLEIGGILVSVLGSVLVMQTNDDEGSYTQESIIIGDLIAFLGSVFGAFIVQIMSPLMQFYRDGIYGIQSNIACALISYLAAILSKDHVELSFNPHYGMFGFLHSSNLLITIIGFGLVYTYGYLFSLYTSARHLSPLLVSLTFMVLPILAQIFSTIFGLEPLPGMMTWLGGSVVIVGLVMVASAGQTVKVRQRSIGGSGSYLSKEVEKELQEIRQNLNS